MNKPHLTRNYTFVRGMHTIFSALSAASFSLLLWRTLQLFVSHFSEPMAIPFLLTFGFSILAISGEIVLSTAFPGKRIEASFRWRIILIMLLTAYISASLFQPGGWVIRFFPGFENISFTVIILFVFASMGSAHQPLLHREELIAIFEGKKGDVLLELLQHEHPQILEALAGIRRNNNRSILLLLGAILCNLALWLALINPGADPLFIVLAVFVFITSLLGLALGNSYLDDHRSLLRTSLYSLDQRVSRLVLSLILLTSSLLIGWIFSGGGSLLPTSLIVAFFVWLAGLLTPRAEDRFAAELQQVFQSEPQVFPLIDPELAEKAYDASRIWELIFEILRNALIIGGIGALIFFLIYPALKKGAIKHWIQGIRSGIGRGFWNRSFITILRVYRGLKRLLSDLFRRRDKNWTTPGISENEFVGQYLRELDKSTQTKARKEFISQFAALFSRFVNQLTRFDVPLTRDATLRELVVQAESFHPGLGIGEAGKAIVTSFEHILYDQKVSWDALKMKSHLDTVESELGKWKSIILPDQEDQVSSDLP